jgi:translation initiation factor 2B subunit (eIF-2B alpha/beta/delta family)
MDTGLRRALGRIARDRRSGAAELALVATDALLTWTRRRPRPTESELEDVARVLLRAQPAMAPLIRLANDLALAIDAPRPVAALGPALHRFRAILTRGPRRIAQDCHRWLARQHPGAEVVTYSYSSTVLRALRRARTSISGVSCSESRPQNEGRAMAEQLAGAGLKVFYSTDACLTGQVWPRQVFVFGADAILPGWVANKVGTKALTRLAIAKSCPVVFLTDTTKFLPKPACDLWDSVFGPDEELWPAAPAGVNVYNLYFELTPVTKVSRFRFLTERGWMTPRQVRRALAKIRVSPRLAALAR